MAEQVIVATATFPKVDHRLDCPCLRCADRRSFLRSIGHPTVNPRDWRGVVLDQ